MRDEPHAELSSVDVEARRSDRDDVRRGGRWSTAGQLSRAALPVLLAVVTRVYGPTLFGIYVALQAGVTFGAKVSTLGLDRAMTYWVPRSRRAGLPDAIPAAAIAVATASAVCAALIALLVVPAWAAHASLPTSPLLIGLLALPATALVELAAYSEVGYRRMRVQVIARDLVVPGGTLGLALALRDVVADGAMALAAAFVVASWCGLALAVFLLVDTMRRAGESRPTTFALPVGLRAVAWPLLGTDLAGATMLQLDRLMLTFLISPAALGIYGVAQQMGATVRSLRSGMDGMVSAVVASTEGHADRGRVRAGLDEAAGWVLELQGLVAGVIVALGPKLTGLFGEGFEDAASAAAVLCVGHAVLGAPSLAGAALIGLGRTRANLVTNSLGAAVMAAALAWLAPAFGPIGAAAAVIVGFAVRAAAEWAFLGVALGVMPLGRGTAKPVSRVLGAAAFAWLALACITPMHDLGARVLATTVIVAALVPPLVFRMRPATA